MENTISCCECQKVINLQDNRYKCGNPSCKKVMCTSCRDTCESKFRCKKCYDILCSECLKNSDNEYCSSRCKEARIKNIMCDCYKIFIAIFLIIFVMIEFLMVVAIANYYRLGPFGVSIISIIMILIFSGILFAILYYLWKMKLLLY